MPQFEGITGVIGAVMLIVTIVFAAIAALNRETVRTLRENNKDLTDRVTILEATEIRQTAEVSQEKAENAVLRTIVTGEVKLAAIETMLNVHHQQAQRAWEHVDEQLSAIRRSVEGKP